MDVVPQSRIDLFAEMESHYEKQDTEYFVKLLEHEDYVCLLYTSPSPRDRSLSRMPSSA